MRSNYANANWFQPKPFQVFPRDDWSTDFEPARISEENSAGTCAQLVEKLLTNCGSGSRCDEAFSALKKKIVTAAYTGHWTVLALPGEQAAMDVTPPTMAEKLGMIRDAFGLSVGSFAELLKASRASVYNWLEHEPPNERFVQRIDLLHVIANEWAAMNSYHYPPGKLMKQKLGDGPSMQDRLRREVLDMGEVRKGLQDLLALMHNQRQNMDRAKTRSSKVQGDQTSRGELLERITGSVATDE